MIQVLSPPELELLYFAPSTGGFYSSHVHVGVGAIPADAVEISPELHRELMLGAAAGHAIVADPGGTPSLRAAAAPTVQELRAALDAQARTEAQRRILLFAPLWSQSNDTAAIAAAAGGDEVDPSDLAAAKSRRERINAVRAACRALQAEIGGASADDLPTLDPALDVHWPVVSSPVSNPLSPPEI